MTQLALDLERPPGKGPKVEPWQVDELIEALFEAHNWRTADDLGFHTESEKRVLRAIAAKSGGHVISGQGGYRLHFEATADESRIAIGGWRSMKEELERRIIEAELVYHRKEVPACLRDRVEAARPAA